MPKHRGRGMAAINYPIGMNLGGDPSQALVHSNPDGKFTVTLSAIDLGQGMKQVTRQIAAETLGVPIADVYVDTADSDTGPHDMGSFASRGTHRVGNAVMVAAKEARGVMMEAAAEELEVNAADLDTDGRGNIHVKGAPSRAMTVKDVAIAAQFRQGKTIAGRGIFLIPLSEVNPETGEMSPVSCYAHACLVADLEVDDETGEVTMLKMTSAYELGRAINPKMVEQQLVGGAWMGMSHALYETPEPYYPDIAHGPRDFNEYVMPGPGDICPHDIAVLERPAPDGPFGGKGPGEMCANPVLPAVANAIFNAVGVRIDELPITPEKVLRAIKAQGGARPQGAAGRAALSHGGACQSRRHRQPRGAGECAAQRLLSGRRRPRHRRLPGAGARQAAAARRRARRRQDGSRQGDLGRARAPPDPPAMLRRHRRRGRALRMELSAPDAGDPPGRRPAGRHLSRRVPDRAADAAGAARARQRRVAAGRDRPLGSRVRGAAARIPVRFHHLDPRARHAVGARAPGRDPHLQPHARPARGAAAALRLPLHRLPGARARSPASS